MKNYEIVKLHKGTKYEKEVVRALLRHDKKGNLIETGPPRKLMLGSIKDFKYSASGNIRSEKAIEKAIIQAIHDLKDSQGLATGIKTSKTLKDLWKEYLDFLGSEKSGVTLEKRKEKTIYKSDVGFKSYLKVFGNHSINRFPNNFQQRFMLSTKLDVKPATVRSYGIAVNMFFKWAFEYEKIPGKLLKLDLPRLQKNDYLPETFSPEEIERIEDHLKEKLALRSLKPTRNKYKTSKGMATLNQLRAFTLFKLRGLRASDVWRLRLTDIKLDQGLIELVNVKEDGGKTNRGKEFKIESNVKSRAKEKVDLTTSLVQWLKDDLESRSEQEYWFLDNGLGSNFYSSPESISKAFKRILNQLQIKGPKPTHGFRATVITDLCKINPLLGQQLARHQDISTTLTHYFDGSRDALVSALERRENRI